MNRKTFVLYENIFTENEKLAKKNNEYFTENGIFVINILGSPGAGKTSVIINLSQILKVKKIHHLVIEGDVASDVDAKKLNELGIPAFQINTYGACHLDGKLIEKAIESDFIKKNISNNLKNNENILNSNFKTILFIENIGNLICPAEFLIGEHIKIVVSSVPEGDDKPYKYPIIFEKSAAVILNKYDLIDAFDFNEDFFEKGVKLNNPESLIFKTSSKNSTGFEKVISFIEETITRYNTYK